MESLTFSLSRFYESIGNGLLQFPLSSFDYVDMVQYSSIMDSFSDDDKRIDISRALSELERRMSKDYFQKVFTAQTHVMHYASTQYPSYGFIMPEDLAEDWLATVDFHKSFARDHSLHQPLTAYIVAELLGYGDPAKALTIPNDYHDLLSYCTQSVFDSGSFILDEAQKVGFPQRLLEKDELSFAFWMDFFYRSAILSALFHDMGYPWQYLGRIGYSLGKNVRELGLSNPNPNDIVGRFKARLIARPFCQYKQYDPTQPPYINESATKLIEAALNTHGLPGGIAFLELYDAIRNYPSSSPQSIEHNFCIEWAAMGIVMHDMSSVHKKNKSLRLNFAVDPLSSVVSLADYLEEFERPNVDFSQMNDDETKMTYKHGVDSVILSVNGSTLNVLMKYTTQGQLANANHYKQKETKDYFDSNEGFIDMRSIGIKSVVFKGELESPSSEAMKEL